MPVHDYGVAIGTVVSFQRDPPDQYGRWYHGHLTIATPQGNYTSALDVDTPTGVGVSYRAIYRLDAAAFSNVSNLPDGFHSLGPTATTGALDYVRSPMLAEPPGCFFSFLMPVLDVLVQWLLGKTTWISSTGDNALTLLEQQLPGAARVFLFGAHYTDGLGVHDVHLNQGDPAGSQWWATDGIWQDGAVVVQRPEGNLVAWLVKFNSQSLSTDANGHPA